MSFPGLANNDFLVNLLALQQDGREAISAPANWTRSKPLLEVQTPIDLVVEDLSTGILRGATGNSEGRWHFFVGSPGNGKSAAIGRLCRTLLQSRGCRVLDEQSRPIANLGATDIPYALDVFEGSNAYPSARIVQDASVVANPFAPNADPSAELTATLEFAWKRGISLVVCTNRGVIEKVLRDGGQIPSVSETPWFAAILRLFSKTAPEPANPQETLAFDAAKKVYAAARLSSTSLDNRSLVIGSGTFEEILKAAADSRQWQACGTCVAKSMCPFRANREWLSDAGSRESFLVLLRRAEALSGQIIVFREALALVSLLLAGCPRDYGATHPCHWVQEKVFAGDWFALAMRRFYMCLFAGHTRNGLESNPDVGERQLQGLRAIHPHLGSTTPAARALNHVLSGRPPATDLGVGRLLSREGVFSELAPWREPLPQGFADKWDGDYAQVRNLGVPQVGPLELECLTTWAAIEDAIASKADHLSVAANWGLRRWSSTFLLALGACVDRVTAWDDELEESVVYLTILKKAPAARSLPERRKVEELDKRLNDVLSPQPPSAIGGATVALSDFVTLSGSWVERNLRPHAVPASESSALGVPIEFGERDGPRKRERALLPVSVLIWLLRKANTGLDSRCIPLSHLTGVSSARARAAARGQYAVAERDVELVVAAADGRTIYRLTRLDGDVDVSCE